MKIKIQVIEYLFHFIGMNDWIDHAQMRFRNHGHTAESTICVDRNGLVCVRGKQFGEAAYPISVYAVDEAPYKPQGMIGKREKVPNAG